MDRVYIICCFLMASMLNIQTILTNIQKWTGVCMNHKKCIVGKTFLLIENRFTLRPLTGPLQAFVTVLPVRIYAWPVHLLISA